MIILRFKLMNRNCSDSQKPKFTRQNEETSHEIRGLDGVIKGPPVKTHGSVEHGSTEPCVFTVSLGHFPDLKPIRRLC